MSGYIQLEELDRLKRGSSAEKLKEPGFGSVCCSYCCLLTGFSGLFLLALFSLCLYKQWYFEAEWALPTPKTDVYNEKALVFLVGAILEGVVGVLSVFWVRSVQRKQAAVKLAKEQ